MNLFFSLPPDVALIGGTDLNDTDNRPIPVMDVIKHRGYTDKLSYHDIALISLKYESNETPICIWALYSLDEVNVTAIGYGHTRFGKN